MLDQDLIWQVACAALVVSCLRLHAPAFVLVTLATALCLQQLSSLDSSSRLPPPPYVYGPHLPPTAQDEGLSARHAATGDRTANPRKYAAQEKKEEEEPTADRKQPTAVTVTTRRHAAELPPLRDAQSHRRLQEALARELPTRKPQPRLDDAFFPSE